MSTKETVKCRICKIELSIDVFKVRKNGERMKACTPCRTKFKCKYEGCDKGYSKPAELKRHIKRVHLKIKDIQCQQCEYKTFNSSILKQHIKQVHLKIKDHECSDCNYKTSSSTNLKHHIKQVHLKIKDHECSDCNYKTSNIDSLKRHIKRVHLKIRDHQCPDCKSKFFQSSHLKRHIKQVHLKIKDHQCPGCEYKCCTKDDLKLHMDRCTGDRVGSSGEVKIKDVLDDMKIPFQYDTSYIVKSPTGNMLRWDFIISHNGKKHFIEYNGRQHYEPVAFGGMSKEQAEANFEKQKNHDAIKNKYCEDNDCPLLWIPYTDYGNIPQILTDFAVKYLNWGNE